MAFDDILVYTASFDPLPAHVGHAARLAARQRAHLTGLHVLPPLDVLTLPDDARLLAAIEAQRRSRLARARDAAGAFADFARTLGARNTDWLAAEGDPATVAALVGATYDVLVVGTGEHSGCVSTDPIEAMLLDAGIPVLLVPESAATSAPVFDTIAIAWNGSIEAWRALRASTPLLARARRVVLLAGEQRGYRTVTVPPALDVEAYLQRHTVSYERQAFTADDAQAGPALLAAAERCGADLLAMGAYGHSRMREWLLGGATRHVLCNSPIPVFMRH